MARPRRGALTPRLAEFRRHRGLTQEQVAETLGITAEMVRRHEKGLARPIETYRKRYCALYQASHVELGLTASAGSSAQLLDIDELLAGIADSATAGEAIQQLDRAVTDLAERHTQMSPRSVLDEVLRVHEQLRHLKAQRKRLSQTRELYRIESELLSHACLLHGDLQQNPIAEKFGKAALLLANECGSNDALPRTALAKTLRWEERLIESAAMARVGYDGSPARPVRIQLASQEANAAALLGDRSRATEALRRAELAAEQCESDSGQSAWSFSTGRQAIFALSVATNTGNPKRALRAAATADDAWEAGEPKVLANLAQIRVGAGVAHLVMGSLEAAEQQVVPVFSIPPDLRVSTVTAYTTDLGRRLSRAKFRGDKIATETTGGYPRLQRWSTRKLKEER